jgi:hypothetical protein
MNLHEVLRVIDRVEADDPCELSIPQLLADVPVFDWALRFMEAEMLRCQAEIDRRAAPRRGVIP